MTADTLRRAAGTLRDKANAATPGPWAVREVGAGGWFDVTTTRQSPAAPRSITNGGADQGGDAIGASCETDADYIATMQPTVAFALADWLESELAVVTTYLDGHPLDGEPIWAAVAVARAILGETP